MAEQKNQKNQKVFGRDDFLNLPEPTVQKVYCESLGGYLYIKPMSALDQDSYDSELINIETDKNGKQKMKQNWEAMRAKYLVRVLCDPEGNRLFRNDEYKLLGKKFSNVIRDIHSLALKVNGEDDESLEKLEKNSGTG